MSILTAKTITEMFERNKKTAQAKLAELEVFCGRTPAVSGLNGWIFEQTIQHCLTKELRAIGFASPEFQEQCSLGGKVKADLVIARLAIEIKLAGLFGAQEAEKYRRYSAAANKVELEYVFFTLREWHQPYREAIINALGRDNVFFLEEPDEWDRFVARIEGETQ